MSEALVKPSRADEFRQWVETKTTEVIAALPLTVSDTELKRARSRLRVALSEDSQGKLYECTPESVGRAIVLSAISGLFPGGPSPDVWLIARKNKHKGGVPECNWQMSFRGYIRLARRVGWDLEPVLVFEGDDFDYEEGMAPKVTHRPALDAPQTWETLRFGYVRVFPQDRRYTKLAILTKDRIQQRRSVAQDQGIWSKWPLEQSLKTICHYAGAREMFPCDDPTRYAIAADMEAEAGADEGRARRLDAPGVTLQSLRELTGSGETVEVEVPARIVDFVPVESSAEEEGDAPPAESPGESSATATSPAPLSSEALRRIEEAAVAHGLVFPVGVENILGGPMRDYNASDETMILHEIRKAAKGRKG